MPAETPSRPPLIGITTDLAEHANGPRVFAYRTYVEAVRGAGGVPVLLPPGGADAAELVGRLDGFVLTGGDDPKTEPFGEPTDPRTTPVHADRQAFETALLRALEAARPDAPVLGVCLGMQMMALVAGGRLNQHMPETCPTHAEHWERDHAVEPEAGFAAGAPVLRGVVRSRHRQAVAGPGGMDVIARAPDGVVEAIRDPGRRWYVGVQWHPERTGDYAVGAALFAALVGACAGP